MSVRLSVPASAKRGESIELKALMQHKMESGFRRDAKGAVIERDIVTEFVCNYGGQQVFRWQLNPGIAANPFITFYVRATETAPLEFRWTDQHGDVTVEKTELKVG
ncbi:MAG: thiosulfate oxidation carrier complex protein SoxZ [Pseudomonadota bacterium]